MSLRTLCILLYFVQFVWGQNSTIIATPATCLVGGDPCVSSADCCGTLVCSGLATKNCATPPDSSITFGDQPLRVAVHNVQPFFSNEDEDGNAISPTGFSFELWEAIWPAFRQDIQTLGYTGGAEYNLLVFDTLEDVLRALSLREVDICIAPMSITDAREAAYDMSSPYFTGGLQILARSKADVSNVNIFG